LTLVTQCVPGARHLVLLPSLLPNLPIVFPCYFVLLVFYCCFVICRFLWI